MINRIMWITKRNGPPDLEGPNNIIYTGWGGDCVSGLDTPSLYTQNYPKMPLQATPCLDTSHNIH